jgi:predicted enzyme involved in methoxymalonyl-ACP biosynthesis
MLLSFLKDSIMEVINGTNFSGSKEKVINLEEWSKLIIAWKNGTESQRKFCARLGLNINTFTYAKRKLSAKNKQEKFVPIVIRQETPSKLMSNIILENAKGMKLYIPLTSISEEMINLLKMAGW